MAPLTLRAPLAGPAGAALPLVRGACLRRSDARRFAARHRRWGEHSVRAAAHGAAHATAAHGQPKNTFMSFTPFTVPPGGAFDPLRLGGSLGELAPPRGESRNPDPESRKRARGFANGFRVSGSGFRRGSRRGHRRGKGGRAAGRPPSPAFAPVPRYFTMITVAPWPTMSAATPVGTSPA